MSFFRAGYSVSYIQIEAPPRIGKSHIRLVRDGIRFFLIIFKIGTLFSPLKLFVPISVAFFLTGLGYYLFTYLAFHRFTNMSATLFITAIQVFLMGLVSEQISALNYKDSEAQAAADAALQTQTDSDIDEQSRRANVVTGERTVVSNRERSI
jgi:hypothetical protein